MRASRLPTKVYPIFAAIGGACVLCAAQCGRQLLSSPDVRIVKSERAMGVLEDKRFHKEGSEFREHGLRRCVPRHARGRARYSPAALRTASGGEGFTAPRRRSRRFLRTQTPQIFPGLNAKLGGA